MSTLEDLQSEIESLLAAGQHYRAWAAMVRCLETQPRGAACHYVARLSERLDPKAAELKPVKVALLGTFTLEPLVPLLKAHALRSRLALTIYTGGYNAWQQEALSPESGLHAFKPDVIFAALRPEEVCPSLVQGFTAMDEAGIEKEVSGAAQSIESALTALRRESKAKIVLHNAAPPVAPAFGVIDYSLATGQSEAFRQLNSRLVELTRKISGVWLFDYARLVARIGETRWHDARLWGLGKLPLSHTAMHALAEEYVAYLRAFSGLTRKVLVLDLDNTLWGGVVGEVGPNGIQLGPDYPGSAFVELQRVVLSFYHRGVVIGLNSKNNEADAEEVLTNHPWMVLRPDHYAAKRINWQDKVANMEELARELGLNLDSFVFVDDSQVECERMRMALPQVLTVCLAAEPGERAAQIRSLTAFDAASYSEEDKRRGEFYQKDAARKKLQASVASLEEFYESLQMHLLIEKVGTRGASRASELTQRTNQFNLTTRRRTKEEIEGLIGNPDYEVYSMRLRDRFGDNGTIGLIIGRRLESRLEIEDFLMSCRVIGRTVEEAALTFLLRRAQALGLEEVRGVFRPTSKNAQVAGFYPKAGFALVEETPSGTWYALPAQEFSREFPKWFQIVLPEES